MPIPGSCCCHGDWLERDFFNNATTSKYLHVKVSFVGHPCSFRVTFENYVLLFIQLHVFT